jgi:hypothetical protein
VVLCEPPPPLSATPNVQRHEFCSHADWLCGENENGNAFSYRAGTVAHGIPCAAIDSVDLRRRLHHRRCNASSPGPSSSNLAGRIKPHSLTASAATRTRLGFKRFIESNSSARPSHWSAHLRAESFPEESCRLSRPIWVAHISSCGVSERAYTVTSVTDNRV